MITQLSRTGLSFKAVTFLNDQTGYASGNSDIRRTTNGGLNWDSLTFDIGMSTEIRTIYFDNVNTGYAAGNGSQILKTTNMGNHWVLQSAPYSQYYRSIYFVNVNTGYAVGDQYKIAKTTNGGIVWDSLSSGRFFYSIPLLGLRTVYFTDANNGYAMGDSIYIKTTNGGATWNDLPSTENRWFQAMYFINQTTGFIGDEFGTILKTTNGGNGFSEINTGSRGFIFSIHFPSQNTGYAIKNSSPGKVLKTIDAGESWFEIANSSLNHFYSSIFFTDVNTGYAVMDFVKKTTNGGVNWVIQNTNISTPYSVYFINSETGFVAGSDGGISKTTNSGDYWKMQNSGTTSQLRSVYFVNPDVGYVCGAGGTILKSTNQGEDWSNQISDITSDISAVTFSNVNRGYAVSDGKILFTSDGGASWIVQYSDNNYYSAVQFLNLDVGFVAPYGGYILKTTTGGIISNFGPDQTETADEFNLKQNYPNPFNPVTNLEFGISKLEFVSLKVYDVLGNEIKTLVNEMKTPGVYNVEFDGSNLPSGIYYYKIAAGNFSEVRKMMLLK